MRSVFIFGKSLVSGGIAAFVDLGALYILFGKAHLNQSVAVNCAFGAGIMTNFILQKFWTFREPQLRAVHVQFMKFLVVAFMNMALNAAAMSLLVSGLGFWYLGAQALTLGSLAVVNFIAYRSYIFLPDVQG